MARATRRAGQFRSRRELAGHCAGQFRHLGAVVCLAMFTSGVKIARRALRAARDRLRRPSREVRPKVQRVVGKPTKPHKFPAKRGARRSIRAARVPKPAAPAPSLPTTATAARDPRCPLLPSPAAILDLRRLPAGARRAALRWWPGAVPGAWIESLADSTPGSTPGVPASSSASSSEISGLRAWRGKQGRAWITSLRTLPWAARLGALERWPGHVDARTRWTVLRLGEAEGEGLRCLPVTARAAAIAAMAAEAFGEEAFSQLPSREKMLVARQLAKLILGRTFAAWTDEVVRRFG